MTKRPADRTPPGSLPPKSPKLARQEGLHSHTLDSSEQEIGSPTHQSSNPEGLEQFIKFLRLTADVGDSSIYTVMTLLWKQGLIEGPSDLVSQDNFSENVQRYPNFSVLLKSALREGASVQDKQALVAHDAFWTPSLPKCQPKVISETVSVQSQETAVVNSWNAEFIDEGPLDGLKSHIAHQLSKKSVGKIYAHYCSIVQSSGMGKSRLLDEFSKCFFLIPINLRPTNSEGFPPADAQVRDFLSGSGSPVENGDALATAAHSRAFHFLISLFEKAEKVVDTFHCRSKEERVQQFRKFMSDGQSMRRTGRNRESFYDDVINRAQNVQSSDLSRDLADSFGRLRSTLGEETETCRILPKDGNTFVDIFIAFDEAHSLTPPFNDEDPRSNFTELRRALRDMLPVLNPLWTFFLSTTGKITQFSLLRGLDPSSRINRGKLITPSPYIHLGFDQLMRKRPITEDSTLDEITSIECIAHMGRPMWGTRYDHGNEYVRKGLLEFAVHKLLGNIEEGKPLNDAQTYAVLSQRLALDIDTPQYLLTSASPLALMETMHDQIANHMRVCLAVGSGIESLRGVASSEPILSEAAYRIMVDEGLNFNLPQALSSVLSGFCIHQGSRGELLVAAFFTWARDRAVSTKSQLPPNALCHQFTACDLFSSLFCGSSLDSILDSKPSLCHTGVEPEPFSRVFSKANMHFNHFIKPYEQKIISRRYLVRFLARGAAVLGANCQPGFDAVYPYIYNATNLDAEKVGFIIVQVKNDSNASRVNAKEVFKKMDPFECGLLDKSSKTPFTIPIIRILFSLSGDNLAVEPQQYERPSDGAVTLGKDRQPLFTSYDYVCSGVDPNTLQPVQGRPELWRALVNKRTDWHDFLGASEEERKILCSELPLGGMDDAHFSRWWSDRTGRSSNDSEGSRITKAT